MGLTSDPNWGGVGDAGNALFSVTLYNFQKRGGRGLPFMNFF